MKLTAKIIGSGAYLPDKILTNKDLEQLVDTSHEWIVSRTGMHERRIAQSESTSLLGAKAAMQALANANLNSSDIDCIIVATCTPDYQALNTACIIQKIIGASQAAAMDIQATCSGYLYALQLAQSLIQSQTYNNILVIASEKLSSITNYQDRSTCILFGDGAAATVVSNSKAPGLLIKNLLLGADGEYMYSGYVPAGGASQPTSQQTLDDKLHYIQMSGQEIFKVAVRKMVEASNRALESTQLTVDDIHWLVPHQANLRIIEAVAARFNISMKNVMTTLKKYGNTSASSIGIALNELIASKQLKNNQNILLTAVGFGLTWGSGILEYQT